MWDSNSLKDFLSSPFEYYITNKEHTSLINDYGGVQSLIDIIKSIEVDKANKKIINDVFFDKKLIKEITLEQKISRATAYRRLFSTLKLISSELNKILDSKQKNHQTSLPIFSKDDILRSVKILFLYNNMSNYDKIEKTIIHKLNIFAASYYRNRFSIEKSNILEIDILNAFKVLMEEQISMLEERSKCNLERTKKILIMYIVLYQKYILKKTRHQIAINIKESFQTDITEKSASYERLIDQAKILFADQLWGEQEKARKVI